MLGDVSIVFIVLKCNFCLKHIKMLFMFTYDRANNLEGVIYDKRYV